MEQPKINVKDWMEKLPIINGEKGMENKIFQSIKRGQRRMLDGNCNPFVLEFSKHDLNQ
jgi:hypothetical protein